ncbi:MAG: SDR family oxidoreductase [Pyrinomonadaceae bacterium]
MKILILGGTGFLGRHLAEAALARGHELTLFNRGVRAPELFPNVERLQGDRKGNLEALRGRSWDAVVDTSGYVPSDVQKSAELLADNVEHYTFISSQSVYANFEKPKIDESHPVQTLTDEQVREAEEIDPEGPTVAVSYREMYGGLKALCERAADEAMQGRALNVRAGLIVGPHDYADRFTYWVRRISQGGEVLAPGKPDNPVQVIDARDLAEWILRMAESRSTGTFNATGPDYQLTMGEMLNTCKAVTGSDARFEWVSSKFLEGASADGWEEVPLWFADEPILANFMSVDCSKAFAAGLTFRPLAETARDTFIWDSERSKDVELKVGLRPEREREILQAWRDSKETVSSGA